MKNLQIAMKQTDRCIRKQEERLTTLKADLIHELRHRADFFEQLPQEVSITNADIARIQQYITLIEESTARLNALKAQKDLIEFIGEE